MLSGILVPVSTPKLVTPTISIVSAGVDALRSRNDALVSDRWINGIAYQVEDNASLHISDPCSTATDRLALESQAAVAEWVPYMITAEDRCPPFGFLEHDYLGRVTRRLEVGTPKALERELWSGEAAKAAPVTDAQPGGSPAFTTNLWLASPHAALLNPVAGTPVTMRRAFELLEQAISDNGLGSQGMIHCRPEALPYIPTLRRDGNVIRTIRDVILVPGVGYPNTGPDGSAAAAGTTWLYATGMVEYWLDTKYQYTPEAVETEKDPRAWMSQAIDRTTNDVVVRAHRYGMATWDGLCHYAVQANLDT